MRWPARILRGLVLIWAAFICFASVLMFGLIWHIHQYTHHSISNAFDSLRDWLKWLSPPFSFGLRLVCDVFHCMMRLYTSLRELSNEHVGTFIISSSMFYEVHQSSYPPTDGEDRWQFNTVELTQAALLGSAFTFAMFNTPLFSQMLEAAKSVRWYGEDEPMSTKPKHSLR